MKKKSAAFYAQLSLTLVVCAFLMVPVIQSILAGLTVNYIVGVKSGLTLKWFAKVWELYRDTIFLSILIGLACLGCTLVLGVPAAYTMVKRQNRFTRLFEELLVTPLAVPGLATALGLIITYGGITGFRMSWLFILTGHVIFTLPFMVRSVIAVMSSIDLNQFEEGAASLGAGFWSRFFYIALPNAMPGILAGSLMVFTLSIGEFNLTWMLHTPMTKTLPVGLADSYASMRLEIGSAYTIAFFLMIIPLLVAMQWVAMPRKMKSPPEVVSAPFHSRTGIRHEEHESDPGLRTSPGGKKNGLRYVAAFGELLKDLCRRHPGASAFQPDRRGRRDGGHPGPFGMRQDDAAPDHRRPRITRCGGKGLLR